MVPQRGSFNCLEDGAVHMTLDNTYSLVKSKVVIYNFELLEHELTSGMRESVRASVYACLYARAYYLHHSCSARVCVRGCLYPYIYIYKYNPYIT